MTRRPRVLLVCSPGGHLAQMLSVQDACEGYDCVWVTYQGADVPHLLESREVELVHGPTNRSIKNLLRNAILGWRLIRRHRPAAIISTGAGIALPFFWLGKLHGSRLIFVESLARVHGLSVTGKLVYPVADHFFIQWPNVTTWKRARFEGDLL